MVKEIIWSEQAGRDFDGIVDYIDKKWGRLIAMNFVTSVYEVLDTLSLFPEAGSVEEPDLQIRGFVISKQTTLFYRISEANIILLSFFDTRSIKKKF